MESVQVKHTHKVMLVYYIVGHLLVGGGSRPREEKSSVLPSSETSSRNWENPPTKPDTKQTNFAILYTSYIIICIQIILLYLEPMYIQAG